MEFSSLVEWVLSRRRKPVVCGVTSLGLDHVKLLGDTIDKIAWQKAGIFKQGVPAITVPQLPEAMKVLHERAAERRVCSISGKLSIILFIIRR